jgi:hypothetical protein
MYTSENYTQAWINKLHNYERLVLLLKHLK